MPFSALPTVELLQPIVNVCPSPIKTLTFSVAVAVSLGYLGEADRPGGEAMGQGLFAPPNEPRNTCSN